MILPSKTLLEKVKFPLGLDSFQVRPHAIDLRVGESFTLQPGEARNFRTLDSVKMPSDVAGVVFPRSSLTRRNISLAMTGVVDANYEGQLTLPLVNHSKESFNVRKGDRIASIMFWQLEEPAALVLSKYHKGGEAFIPDKDEEESLIASGDLENLRTRFPVSES